MFKHFNFKSGLTILCLTLPLLAQAKICPAADGSNAACDFTIVAPVFTDVCVGTTESGTYTIRNNRTFALSPTSYQITPDSLPSSYTTIGNSNCGSSLAGGSTCNLTVNITPADVGVFHRTLQASDNYQTMMNTNPYDITSAAVRCIVPPTPVCTPGVDCPTPLTPTLLRTSILGHSTVTNTGPTNINGNLDLSPGSAVTGFPPGTFSGGGVIHVNDAEANQAQTDAHNYYLSAQGLPCGTNLTGQDLAGMTLAPGVYCFNTSAGLTTGASPTLHLSGGANSVYVFQIGTTLTTGSNAAVVLGSVSSGNVTWAVGSSATLGTGTAFAGIIDAAVSITMNTGASLNGRLWAQGPTGGAVTLDTNAINPQ